MDQTTCLFSHILFTLFVILAQFYTDDTSLFCSFRWLFCTIFSATGAEKSSCRPTAQELSAGGGTGRWDGGAGSTGQLQHVRFVFDVSPYFTIR